MKRQSQITGSNPNTQGPSGNQSPAGGDFGGREVQQGEAGFCYFAKGSPLPLEISKTILCRVGVQNFISFSQASKDSNELAHLLMHELLNDSRKPGSNDKNINPFVEAIMPNFTTGHFEVPIFYYQHALKHKQHWLCDRYCSIFKSHFDIYIQALLRSGFELSEIDDNSYELLNCEDGSVLHFHNDENALSCILVRLFREQCLGRDEHLNKKNMACLFKFIRKYKSDQVCQAVTHIYLELQKYDSVDAVRNNYNNLCILIGLINADLIDAGEAQELMQLVFKAMAAMQELAKQEIYVDDQGLWEENCFELIKLGVDKELIQLNADNVELLKTYLMRYCGLGAKSFSALFFSILYSLDKSNSELSFDKNDVGAIKGYIAKACSSAIVDVDVDSLSYLMKMNVLDNDDISSLKNIVISKLDEDYNSEAMVNHIVYIRLLWDFVEKFSVKLGEEDIDVLQSIVEIGIDDFNTDDADVDADSYGYDRAMQQYALLILSCVLKKEDLLNLASSLLPLFTKIYDNLDEVPQFLIARMIEHYSLFKDHEDLEIKELATNIVEGLKEMEK